jgi:exosome complex component RRP41
MTREEFDKAISMAVDACHKVYDIQKDALKRRYSMKNEESDSDE